MSNIAMYFFPPYLSSGVPCKMAAAVASISGGGGEEKRRGSSGTGGLDCATEFGGKTGAAHECHRYRRESNCSQK